MKTFNEFINQSDYSAFTIGRNSMPQIDNMDSFLKWMDDNGESYYKHPNMETDLLKPTQFDYDQSKVDDIILNGNFDKPVLIGSDFYVLDGHHRYYAAKQSNNVLNVVRSRNKTINQLMRLVLDFKES